MTQALLTLAEAKRQADRLIQRFADLGIKIKRTQALEGIAAVHAASNWNVLASQLKTPPQILPGNKPEQTSFFIHWRNGPRIAGFCHVSGSEVTFPANEHAVIEEKWAALGAPERMALAYPGSKTFCEIHHGRHLKPYAPEHVHQQNYWIICPPATGKTPEKPFKALIGRPGTGKTNALTLHLLAHLESGAPGLAVWFEPVQLGRHEPVHVPDKDRARVQYAHISYWGLDQPKVSTDPITLKPGVRALVISLSCADQLINLVDDPLARVEKMRRVRGEAITRVLTSLASSTSRNRISLLLIDEASRVTFDPAQLESIQASTAPTACRVIAAQTDDPWMDACEIIMPDFEAHNFIRTTLPTPEHTTVHTRAPAQEFNAVLPLAHQTRLYAALGASMATSGPWDGSGLPHVVIDLATTLGEVIAKNGTTRIY